MKNRDSPEELRSPRLALGIPSACERFCPELRCTVLIRHRKKPPCRSFNKGGLRVCVQPAP